MTQKPETRKEREEGGRTEVIGIGRIVKLHIAA